jgi:hypothetical protein
VSAAAADIRLERASDLVLARMRVPIEQRLGRDQDPAEAVPTLARAFVDECLLQRMEAVSIREALDRRDLFPGDRIHRKIT